MHHEFCMSFADRNCNRYIMWRVSMDHSCHIKCLDKHTLVAASHPHRCIGLAMVIKLLGSSINALAIELDAVEVFAHAVPSTVHKPVLEDNTTSDPSRIAYQQQHVTEFPQNLQECFVDVPLNASNI